MVLKLYGMISKIHKDGVISRCEPIFVDYSSKKPTNFYKLEDGKPVQVDLKAYGNPVFLPASRKKIDDNNEYFVVYRPSQNITRGYTQTILVEANDGNDEDALSWLPRPTVLSVGIRFPDGFICVFGKEHTSETLAKYIRD